MTSDQRHSAFRVGPYTDPDRYVLGRAVASGAEGILYRGSILTATGLELDVAIKMLQPRFLPRVDEWHTRWSEQVEVLRSLQVPGVVRVRDGFVGPLPHVFDEAGDDRTLYLIMNWVDGEPLDEWVRKRPDRDPLDSLKLLLEVAVALDLMHSGRATGGTPIVHRDVKPSNILITGEGSVLVDFGLTRGLPDGHRLSGVTGTRGYLPPEAIETGTYTPATDRFALGGVAYFVITGDEPPLHHDPSAMRAALAVTPAAAASPETLELLMAMLDADPDIRPKSLGNWIGQLRRSSLTGLPEVLAPEAAGRNPGVSKSSTDRIRSRERSERVPSDKPRGRQARRRILTGGVCALVLLMLGVVLLVRSESSNHLVRSSSREPDSIAMPTTKAGSPVSADPPSAMNADLSNGRSAPADGPATAGPSTGTPAPASNGAALGQVAPLPASTPSGSRAADPAPQAPVSPTRGPQGSLATAGTAAAAGPAPATPAPAAAPATKVAVPDVYRAYSWDATAQLRSLGFQVGYAVAYTPGSSFEPFAIWSQFPAPGTALDRGSYVWLMQWDKAYCDAHPDEYNQSGNWCYEASPPPTPVLPSPSGR